MATKIKIVKDGSAAAKQRLAGLATRAASGGKVEADVRKIVAAVRRDGDKAVARLTEKFDGVRLTPRRFVVRAKEIDTAVRKVSPATRRALERAHQRIVRFHKHQKEAGFEINENGIRTGMRVLPLSKVGVYVPGGRAAYPSSVLMNIAPAKVAGVGDITVLTPPSKDGIRPEVLAAAKIAGADRVVRIGGAQGIAAAAYGTKTIPRVDKIVGPGNIYVATAKRLVFGQVDIDMIAGPTEVLVVADSTATPEFVATDLLAQAEHDPEAAAVCITTSKKTAERIAHEVEIQLEDLPRRMIAARSIRRYGMIIVVPSLDRAVELTNEIAPEHLELFVRKPRELLDGVLNAGAVFLGEYTTESLGDYAAGPNHVLPTGGSARFSSPLGVYDFLKRMSVIEADRAGLARLAPTIVALAKSEGLDGHALAASRRIERDKK